MGQSATYNNDRRDNRSRYGGDRNTNVSRVRGPVSQGEPTRQNESADLTICRLPIQHTENLLNAIGENITKMVEALDMDGTFTYRVFYDEVDRKMWLETTYTPREIEAPKPTKVGAEVATNNLSPEEDTDIPPEVSPANGESLQMGVIRYFMRMGGRSTDLSGHYRNTVVIFSPTDDRNETSLPPYGIVMQSHPAALARLVTM